MGNQNWYEIDGVEDIVSPALVVFPERIEENIKIMISIAGGVEALRPHVKTHKIAEIIKMQLNYGINKFKCATIAEAELLGKCGAHDILLATQPVGVHITRFFDLIVKYPESKFSAVVDSEIVIQEIARKAAAKNMHVHLWMDINNGMNRTGVLPGKEAVILYQSIHNHPHLIANGLHVYDGHINEPDLKLRKEICDKDFELVLQLKREIEFLGIKVATIVAGGTPTFPIHVKRKNIEVSPGTTLLWDQGYADSFKDLKFLPAAILIGSILSKPRTNLICLNIGHKSVASEMRFPRLKILNIEKTTQLSHSEEHLVVECLESERYTIGTICYAIPMHICPTVIKYNQVLTAKNRRITGFWKVAARDYLIKSTK